MQRKEQKHLISAFLPNVPKLEQFPTAKDISESVSPLPVQTIICTLPEWAFRKTVYLFQVVHR